MSKFVFGIIAMLASLCGSDAEKLEKLERTCVEISKLKDDLDHRRTRRLLDSNGLCDNCISLIEKMKQIVLKAEKLFEKCSTNKNSLHRKELMKEVYELQILMASILKEYHEHDPTNESSHTASRRMISSKFQKNLKQSSEAAKVPAIGDNGGMVSEISHMDVEVRTEAEGVKEIILLPQTSNKHGKGKENAYAYGSIAKNPEASEASTINSLKVASEIFIADEVQISNPNPGGWKNAVLGQSVCPAQELDFPADETAEIFPGPSE